MIQFNATGPIKYRILLAYWRQFLMPEDKPFPDGKLHSKTPIALPKVDPQFLVAADIVKHHFDNFELIVLPNLKQLADYFIVVDELPVLHLYDLVSIQWPNTKQLCDIGQVRYLAIHSDNLKQYIIGVKIDEVLHP